MGHIKNYIFLKSLKGILSEPVNACLDCTEDNIYTPKTRVTGYPKMSRYTVKKIHQQTLILEQNEGDNP